MLSGGLDSTVATAVLLDQEIECDCLNFSTGFCIVEHKRKIAPPEERKHIRNEALRAGSDLQTPVTVIDIADEYLKVVRNPKYGYGSGMNPCIDCRIFMLRKARQYMEEHGGHFVYTGEVLGQRPKSQYRKALETIEEEAGLKGYLLRPLSAKLLPPTIPEQKGWVDRNRLYGIHGRSRKVQMELAEKFRITDYPQPAGGCCFLPDQNYARKIRDIFEYEGTEALTKEQVMLLKAGRHFRINPKLRAIVGRNQMENAYLNNFANSRVVMTTPEVPGPTTLAIGEVDQASLETLAAITARYSDAENGRKTAVEWRQGEKKGSLTVTPIDDQTLDPWRI